MTDSGANIVATAVVSSASESHVLIQNDSVFESLLDGAIDGELFAATQATPLISARHPGALGNGLAVVLIDHEASDVSFVSNSVELHNLENLFPKLTPNTGTSQYAVQQGYAGICDLFHVLVIDTRGRFTGAPGSVVERFESLSKLEDAVTEAGETIYWKDVINERSEYLRVLNNPATSGVPTFDDRVFAVFGSEVALPLTAVQDATIPDIGNIEDPTLVHVDLADGDTFILTAQADIANAVDGVYQWVEVNSTTKEGYAKKIADYIDGQIIFDETNELAYEVVAGAYVSTSFPSIDV